jgi:hypothetical protein
VAERARASSSQPDAELVGADEGDLWPEAGGPLAARTRPDELGTVYQHRWAVPREVWVRLFRSAEREIAILAYSALFLADDAGMLRILADKGRAGVTVRIALGDPYASNVAERGDEEGIGDAMAAKIRNALTLFRPLGTVENVEIRLHRTALYNSIYRADEQMLVNQHTYGIPAAQLRARVGQVCATGWRWGRGSSPWRRLGGGEQCKTAAIGRTPAPASRV